MAEARLWSALNAGQLGAFFRRQVSVGARFNADLALSIKLIVEVDGRYRARRSGTSHARKLARFGYRVVRVSAGLDLADLATAVAFVVPARAVAWSEPCVCRDAGPTPKARSNQRTRQFTPAGGREAVAKRTPSLKRCNAQRLPPPSAPFRVSRSASCSPKGEHGFAGGRRRAARGAGEHRRVPTPHFDV